MLDFPDYRGIPHILVLVFTHWFSGVGFDKNHDDGWIEHQEAFDQILAGLNAEMNSGI